MGYKADSGAKFDRGKVDRILASVSELSESDFNILVDALLKEQKTRNSRNNNSETISV